MPVAIPANAPRSAKAAVVRDIKAAAAAMDGCDGAPNDQRRALAVPRSFRQHPR